MEKNTLKLILFAGIVALLVVACVQQQAEVPIQVIEDPEPEPDVEEPVIEEVAEPAIPIDHPLAENREFNDEEDVFAALDLALVELE